MNEIIDLNICWDRIAQSVPQDDTKWDHRFLQLARLISTFSKDPSTQIGAAIVSPDRTLTSVGFNGFPQGMEDKQEWYDNREIKYSRVVHGEINALIFANGSVRGHTLYTFPFAPCDRCCVQMLQAGIARFVFPKASDEAMERWGPAFEKTYQYILECGASYTEI
jgi:dCMP deaminase